MEIQFSDEGDRLIARPRGRLEAPDGDAFIAAVEAHLADATKRLTLDLRQLEFINFGGIRAILRLARTLKGRGTELSFLHAGGSVWEALDQSGLDDIFPFEPPMRGIRNESRAP